MGGRGVGAGQRAPCSTVGETGGGVIWCLKEPKPPEEGSEGTRARGNSQAPEALGWGYSNAPMSHAQKPLSCLSIEARGVSDWLDSQGYL